MKARVLRGLGAAVVAAALIGCGGPPDIALDEQWPSEPRSYDEATEAWTRYGKARDQFEILIEVHATYKSPAWRAALVEHHARARKLSTQARARLRAEQQSAAEEAHEFELVLTAFGDTEETLDEGEDSPWSIVLIDAEGREVEPSDVDRDRRAEEVLWAEFPHMNEFDEAYVVRFPTDGVTLLGPDARRFSLKITSPRGGTELVWQD